MENVPFIWTDTWIYGIHQTGYYYQAHFELRSLKVMLITSSPHHSQANGLAEAYIKHAENLIIKDLEAGKPCFHVSQEYMGTPIAHNLPSPLEAPYQPSSTTSHQ